MFLLSTISFKVLIFFFRWFAIFIIYVSFCFCFFYIVQGNSAMPKFCPYGFLPPKPGSCVQCDCKPKPKGTYVN